MIPQLIALAVLSTTTNMALAAPHDPSLHSRSTIYDTYTSKAGVTFYESSVDYPVKYNGRSPSCCEEPPSECYAATGENAGQYWEACYFPWTAGDGLSQLSDQMFSSLDQQAADCMTNLHYTQSWTCIGLEGSSCQGSYYQEGGRIQNSYIASHQGGGANYQLTGADSVAIQGGIGALVGINASTNVWYDGGNKYSNVIMFSHIAGPADSEDTPRGALAWLDLRYIGEDTC